jgi:hypothetical protein
MPQKENILIVCGNGKCFSSAQTFTTNTCTFMYMNKSIVTTMEALRLQQQQMDARNAIKRSQSAQQLHS